MTKIEEPKYYCADWPTIEFCGNNCKKADAFISNLFGHRSATPHGFYDPVGFVEASKRNHRRNVIRKAVIELLFRRALRNGVLTPTPHPTKANAFLVRLVH